MINSHPKEASDTPTTRVIFGGRNLKCLAPVSYSGRWLTLTCWGALEKCQWLLFRKTIFKGITNTDVHLQLSFLGKMEMEWTWEIAGRRFMVFAISRKHRNEVGEFRRERKHLFWHHINESQREWEWFCQKYSESVRNLGLHCFSWKTRRHQNKIHTRVCAKRKKMVFFGRIFDTLTPLASQFCQSRPWSTMPRRVIWMQNKNLSIPPYVWHLKAIFIWTLNLLNLQLQIPRYALYLISAIKKWKSSKKSFPPQLISRSFFLLENKINKTIHFSQYQRENDTRQNVIAKESLDNGVDRWDWFLHVYIYIYVYQYIIPVKVFITLYMLFWDFFG